MHTRCVPRPITADVIVRKCLLRDIWQAKTLSLFPVVFVYPDFSLLVCNNLPSRQLDFLRESESGRIYNDSADNFYSDSSGPAGSELGSAFFATVSHHEFVRHSSIP